MNTGRRPLDPSDLSRPAADPALWPLDRGVAFLNHGSFGSCPCEVLALQGEMRLEMERNPIDFLVRKLETALDAAREELAAFLGAAPSDLVVVSNATAGVNTVLRSLDFEPGDELLTTNHEYNACRNALAHAASRAGARVVTVPVPFPLENPDDVVEAILAGVTARTRLVLVDHVTSQTGLVLPLKRIIEALNERGVETLVDGAHAPGMVPLNLSELGASWYTGNCHKWLCAPKGAGFLWSRNDRQTMIRPLSISHGANSVRRDRSRYLIEFGWTGTDDPTAFLCVPAALRFLGNLLPGGWKAVRQRNRDLALAARNTLCAALRITPPAPDEMIGSLVSMPFPPATTNALPTSPLYSDPTQDRLRTRFGVEVPILPWPQPPARLLRISAQLYNALPEYEKLASAIRDPDLFGGDPG